MAEAMDSSSAMDEQNSKRMQMLKDFDSTKAGVKGLSDSGLVKLPKIFVRPSEEVAEDLKHEKEKEKEKEKGGLQLQVPVIDLSQVNEVGGRKKIVEQVRNASERWGFFQVVNHGIPVPVLEGMIDGVRDFHEQDIDEKAKYYSRDTRRSVRFNSNYDLFKSRTASWRDTLSFSFSSATDSLDRDELPFVCRDSTLEYSKGVEILGKTLFGLLSEALGLKTEALEKMECSKGHRLHCHYYPACPEPELAIGTTEHSDTGFLAILLQNQIVSGLQVLCEGQWIDILPVSGGLVINIGDLLQLVSNEKFKSNKHRAIANAIGPRISVACFFSGPVFDMDKIYSPIEELITEEKPAIYRQIVMGEYLMNFLSSPLESYKALDYYKV